MLKFNYQKAMPTQWGKADDVKPLAEGTYFVQTPSHGGVMMGKTVAQRHLTAPARAVGKLWANNWLTFEEDCELAVVIYEHPEWFLNIFTKSPDTAQLRADAFVSLSRWNADYLLARGLIPEPKAYAQYLFYKEEGELRRANSPRLIVSASMITETLTDVYTADGAKHLVTGYIYPRTDGKHNLLDFCTLVKTYGKD